jgi:thioredoxin 1
MATKQITDKEFDETVLKSSKPVLVDFWAEWCGPCRGLAPKLEEIGAEMSSQLEIVKMNVDENRAVPEKFGIRSIPTMILFKDGRDVGQLLGNLPKEEIVALIKKHI